MPQRIPIRVAALVVSLVAAACMRPAEPRVVRAVPGGLDAPPPPALLRGEGVLTLDGSVIKLRPGDAMLVARDRVHWFARRGPEPAVTLVVFTPALDAPDLVPEHEVDSKGGRR